MVVRRVVRPLLRKARAWLFTVGADFVESLAQPAVGRDMQILLSLKYKEMNARGALLPTFDEVGFRAYSDTDEDGILLYIFSLIGSETKTVIDIGCAGVRGSNTANLIINHGWNGVLIDGREDAVEAATRFYRRCRDTMHFPPTVTYAWITAENVDSVIAAKGLPHTEIDLLSIDLDGMDYWIWKAITRVEPRVVIVEYQDIIGPEKRLVVPYRPDFKLSDYPVNRLGADYVGASLPAFVKLGSEKGYRLVGCNRFGYNAFFVKRGIAEELLPEVPVESCFRHPRTQYGIAHRFPRVKDLEWVEV
ncbi:MAG: hypothetical protein HY682_12805 [Chloroflexi bacterium]|nr:hypothetical protein [Chloroflexota bacterium]